MPLLKDTKIQEMTSSGQNRQNHPYNDKIQKTQYNSGMVLPHSPYPWYPVSLIGKTSDVTPHPFKFSESTLVESTCSEISSVPDTKLMEPDPVTTCINSPKKSETSRNEVHIDVIHTEPITANKDQNSPSSDPKKQSLNSLGVSPDYSKLFNLNTDPLNKYKACSKLSEKKSDTPTSTCRPSSV